MSEAKQRDFALYETILALYTSGHSIYAITRTLELPQEVVVGYLRRKWKNLPNPRTENIHYSERKW